MNFTGRLAGVVRDFGSGRPVLQFRINEDISSLDDIAGADLDITAKQHRQRRSLNANAYFYVLCGKIAKKIDRSSDYVHNLMLQRYGYLFDVDGAPFECYFPVALDVSEDPVNHFKPTGRTVEIGGKLKAEYLLLRGSHTYDSHEMAKLIDGTIQEAKQLGIETLTPVELERLKGYEKSNPNRR